MLNWQTQNARAQNAVLGQIYTKIDAVATQVHHTSKQVTSIATLLEKMYEDMNNKVIQLDIELRSMIKHHIWDLEFNQKESEIRNLKAKIARIDVEKQHQQPQLTKSAFLPFQPSTFSTYQPFYTPSLYRTPGQNTNFGLTHTLYQTPT